MFCDRPWRLIEHGSASAAYNMAVDEILLYGYTPDERPVLRLYEWEKSISFGRFQSPQEHMELEKVQKAGIACVRRITGGGILAHGGDLSYSMVLPRNILENRGVKESYRYLCTFLLRLYEAIGLQASFVRDAGVPQARAAVCAAGNEAYDIVVAGKKLGGNAQRYANGVLLQHGSIPLLQKTDFFHPLLKQDTPAVDTLTLEGLGVRMTFETLKDRLKTAFREVFGTELAADELTPSEQKRSEELAMRKYAQKRWNDEALRA